jgi:Nucleotidyl transferase AbiEii toxin, Type IV TA system
LARLRRRVVFERLVARLAWTEPGKWVVKGGMAMEVRLRDDARLTKDIDLGLRDAVADPEELHERVVDALGIDLDADGFLFTAAEPEQLATDGGGTPTWRIKVRVQLAGKAVRHGSTGCVTATA